MLTAVKMFEDAVTGHDHAVDAGGLRSVRFLRRFLPVAERYDGPRLLARAVDSVPAVYGITSDLYLVFVTNAFALLGLRALYFVLEGAMGRLVHLGYGLAAILAFIGAKLVLHWAHLRWESVPEVPTLASLGVILGILTVTVVTSLVATGRAGSRDEREPELTR